MPVTWLSPDGNGWTVAIAGYRDERMPSLLRKGRFARIKGLMALGEPRQAA